MCLLERRVRFLLEDVRLIADAKQQNIGSATRRYYPEVVGAERRIGRGRKIERQAGIRALDDIAMNCGVEKYDGLRAIDEFAQHFDTQLCSWLRSLGKNGVELGHAGLDGLRGLRTRSQNGGAKKDR